MKRIERINNNNNNRKRQKERDESLCLTQNTVFWVKRRRGEVVRTDDNQKNHTVKTSPVQQHQQRLLTGRFDQFGWTC